jgi:hypothetical protein
MIASMSRAPPELIRKAFPRTWYHNRVHPLDLPAVSVMQCLSKWGGGSDKLVAAYDAARSRASSLVNRPTNDNKSQ